MLDRVCDREPEVLDAASTRCGDELGEHIAECASCRDLFDAASAVIDDRRTLMRDARIPSSGLVWWRTQMRARQDAARTARRIINVVQAAAVLVALVAVFLIVGPALPAIHWSLPLILALASPLALAPVAVYFALTEH